MANPIDTIRKMRGKSWEELRTRGGQVLSVYTEQIGLSGNLPSDSEFVGLLEKSHFGNEKMSPENVMDLFYDNADYSFFPSFRLRDSTIEIFLEKFGEKSKSHFIEKAENAVKGRFDLLGYQNLSFGEEVDWHFEPISGKRSPLKHWKQFDELDTSETGDKKIVWELNRHQHFFALGLAFWLTNDEHYTAAFIAHLESWMEQNPPGIGINWFSSLEVAFRLMSWIWGLGFFRDSKILSAEFFQKILKYLYIHGRHIEKYLSTYYSPNTHLTGEALGLYYLGTQFPFFKRAAHWRELGEEILFAELDRQILKDGVYFEQSTWYQHYTVDFYTQFLILQTLNNRKTDKELEQKLSEKLQSLTDFLMFITRPDGTTPLVGDDDGGKCLPHGNSASNDFRSVLSTGAVLFERRDYKYVAESLKEETLWLLGGGGIQSFETLRALVPNSSSIGFEDGGYYVMRDGWAKTDNFMLIDCGSLGAMNGGHGHADALSFDLAVGGKTMLVDAGTYTYHESEKLRDFFRSTKAHNTLTIDEKSSSETNGKFSWQTKANATNHSWISEKRFDFFEGSQDGYERLKYAPATHNRSVLFLKNDYWIVRDFVETTGEHEYNLNFHFNMETNPCIEQAEAGNLCVNQTASSEAGMRLFTFGDNGNWQRKESWISTCYGKKINAPFVSFISNGAGSQEFFSFIMPTYAHIEKPEILETPLVGGRAFVVKYRGYYDLFVFADAENIVRTELFNTNFRFLWSRLSAGETLPEEYVLIGGTKFSLDGREIINYPKELKFAVARRLGNKLNVRSSQSVFSVSLPQSKSKTYILKNQEIFNRDEED